jgi:hypothetical protein
MTTPIGDWIDRIVLPDLYPRKDDPFRPASAVIPPNAPASSMNPAESQVSQDVYQGWITDQAMRPVVYQRAITFNINVTASAVPISNQAFQADTIILDVISTAANSVFFGYGSGVTPTNGIEIRPGIPISIQPENTREMWELQRVIEAIAGMLAAPSGYNPIGKYRAPRVVFNANEYYVVGPANVTSTTLAVLMFTVPEAQ